MELRQSYTVPSATRQTYEAWVSSSTVIAPTKAMEIHPVVAGHYRLIIETPEFVSRNAGRFLEVEPGQHIRYTWERNGDGETSENRRHIFSGGRGNQSYHHSLRIRENRKS